MLAKLKTFSLSGIDAVPIEVEVDVSPAGLPKTILVGLVRGRRPREHAPRGAGDGQIAQSKHHNSRMAADRVSTDICKIEIERQEYPTL